ncbi:MAG: phage tail protein [Devosia sp.]|uniref:portal protein n=1 Tax=Devosia sp. TaxID=1871048 RepID=UPI00260C2F4E|nr:portal protein [Devosia sp.]MDB5540800.1 phage tail protein [Devosia sp.]
MISPDEADRIGRRLAELKSLRLPYEGQMRQCFDYTYPERGEGFTTGPNTISDTSGKRAEIYDDTATDGTRILGSSIIGGMTPANSLWFGLDTGGNDGEMDTRWLSTAAQFLFDNIHASNFDSAAFECVMDMVGGAGHFVLFIDEAREGGYRFEQWPVGQCWVSSSTSGGRVDTIYREFPLTVEQIVKEYGIDQVSDTVKKMHEAKRFDEKIMVTWAIEPRSLHLVGAKMARNKAFASVHKETSGSTTLRESGFDEFPCAVPRWMLIPGSHYAKSPMSQCLATVKTLNEVKKLDLQNFELTAYGMFKARDDGVLNPFTTTIGPRRVVVVSDMDNFQRIEPGGDPKLVAYVVENMQRDIRKLLMADQLQPQDGPAMTATEVHARIMLIRQQLGPIFGRLQSEWLRPLIERCFGIAYRAGVLEQACGPIPDSLRNRIVNVNYSSPLARAQKLEEVTAIDTWVLGLLQVATETQDMSVLDQVNFQYAGQFKADALGVPSKAVRSTDEIASIRQARTEAQQNAAKQAQAQQVQTTAGEAMAKQIATGG